MDDNIKELEISIDQFRGRILSSIPTQGLEEMERLFSNLESFFQGHRELLSLGDQHLKIPKRQEEWFRKASELRKRLRKNLLEVLFQPQNIYDDLKLLFRHSRTILHFILPEFLALQDLKLKR